MKPLPPPKPTRRDETDYRLDIASEIRTRICEVESADDFDPNDVATGEYINGLLEALRIMGFDDEHDNAIARATIAKLADNTGKRPRR